MHFFKKLTVFICIFMATRIILAGSILNQNPLQNLVQSPTTTQFWYELLSPEDQEKYTFKKYNDSPNQRYSLVYDLSSDGRTDIILAAIKTGWFKEEEYHVISALLDNHQEPFLYDLLQDNLIAQKDIVVSLCIEEGKVDVINKVLASGLSKKEIDSVINGLYFDQGMQTVLEENKESSFQALAKFVNFASNHSSEFAKLFKKAHEKYSSGRIMHILKPEFILGEIERCKNLIAESSDINDKQKATLTHMYNHVILNPDISKIPCSLKDDDVRALYDLNLNIWQLIKYFPNTLFDTKSLLASDQSTPTNYMLVNYLNSKYDANLFQQASENKGKNHHCESFMYQEGIYDKLLKIESEMEFEGYHTFVHGRCWNFNFANDMANLVSALAAGKNEMSHDIVLASYDANATVQDLTQQRQKVLACGSQDSSDGICMNSSILSHREKRNFFSGNYFFYNRSDTFQGYSTQYLFKKSDMQKLFNCYKERLKQLHQMHKDASTKGELLAISIKNEKLSDLTYVASWRAEKETRDVNLEWHAALQRAYNAACETNEGYSYYYFALPDIPGERKNRDYVVQSIHTADKQKYAAYQAELQNIFKDMKRDYVQHQNAAK